MIQSTNDGCSSIKKQFTKIYDFFEFFNLNETIWRRLSRCRTAARLDSRARARQQHAQTTTTTTTRASLIQGNTHDRPVGTSGGCHGRPRWVSPRGGGSDVSARVDSPQADDGRNGAVAGPSGGEDGRRQAQLVGALTCSRSWERTGSSQHFGAPLLVRQGWRFRRWPVDASTLALLLAVLPGRAGERRSRGEGGRRSEEERKERANVQQKEEELLLGGPRLSTVLSVCPDLDDNLLEHYPFWKMFTVVCSPCLAVTLPADDVLSIPGTS